MDCWKLRKLQVQNFRNLRNDIFEFVPGINCIFGENGNGKTNILEAIFYITNKKSFRKNASFPQLINIEGEKPEFLILTLFENSEKKLTYSLRANPQIEERYTNGSSENKKSPQISVFLNPFDSFHFHNQANFRRNWLDSHLSIMDKDYKSNLSKFNKALKFRNSILSQKHFSIENQLEAIDQQISEYSFNILNKRVEFCDKLNEHIVKTYKEIFSNEVSLRLGISSLLCDHSQESILNFFKKNYKKDIDSGITRYGIHRDDMVFELNGLNAFEFSSLGQQKMAYLSLIFAYIELFRYKFNSYPLVLIDDVSGELDSQRWKNLIQYLEHKDFQVVITTANESFGVELGLIPNSKKFYINQGKLSFNHG
jgi:DNA replication and repair protein RecF